MVPFIAARAAGLAERIEAPFNATSMLDPSAKASCAGHGGLSARQSLLPECSCRIPVRDTIHLYPRRSGNLRLRRACWLVEPGRPGGKQWGFGAANPPESIPSHRPALPAAISHRTLAASSSTQSQCTRERSKLKLSVPATQQPAFFPKQNPHCVACCCRECPVFNAVFPNRPTTLHQRAQASGSAKPLSEHRERINRRTAVQ